MSIKPKRISSKMGRIKANCSVPRSRNMCNASFFKTAQNPLMLFSYHLLALFACESIAQTSLPKKVLPVERVHASGMPIPDRMQFSDPIRSHRQEDAKNFQKS